MSKFVSVVRGGGGIVVEAALEGPKKAAAHVVGAARGSRGGIDASRRAGPPRKRGPPLRAYSYAPDRHAYGVGGP